MKGNCTNCPKVNCKNYVPGEPESESSNDRMRSRRRAAIGVTDPENGIHKPIMITGPMPVKEALAIEAGLETMGFSKLKVFPVKPQRRSEEEPEFPGNKTEADKEYALFSYKNITKGSEKIPDRAYQRVSDAMPKEAADMLVHALSMIGVSNIEVREV